MVIVDEASMVDLPMMAKLADAIRNDAQLILLGDRYQLASVESGSVLAEICANAGVNRFTADQQTAAGDVDTAQKLLTAGHDDLAYHDRSDAAAISKLMDQLADDYASLIEATDPTLALARLGSASNVC